MSQVLVCCCIHVVWDIDASLGLVYISYIGLIIINIVLVVGKGLIQNIANETSFVVCMSSLGQIYTFTTLGIRICLYTLKYMAGIDIH